MRLSQAFTITDGDECLLIRGILLRICLDSKMATKLLTGNGKANCDIICEETLFVIDLFLKKFVDNPDVKEFEFPSALVPYERAYVHEKAKGLGLKSKSRGKGLTRAVTVYKREGSTIIQADAVISLVRPSRQAVATLLASYPVTNKERQELLPITERDRSFPPEVSMREATKSRLHNGIPIVPPGSVNTELLLFRKTLPIWAMRDTIMQAINTHSVVIISGETGCGKTTQVPQFIMEHSEKAGRGCRIICSMPRRVSAVTVSERVAMERGEPLAKTVGYQIRLETRVSPHTILTYCTYGILLRTLLCGDSLLATVTHVIIDEIHERDRISDFMLVALRDALAKYRGLKLVLMSATLDTAMFSKYFTNCPVISGNTCPIITVPGRLYEVQEYFLEDILKKTSYMTKEMAKVKKELEQVKQNKVDLDSWTTALQANGAATQSTYTPTPILGKQTVETGPEKAELEGHLKQEMDRSIASAWATGSDQVFTQLLQLIMAENISVDYQHSETGVTALMAAAARGCQDAVEHLLSLGAKVNLRSQAGGKTALQLAMDSKHTAIVELLQTYAVYYESDPCKPEVDLELSDESKMLVDTYERCYQDEQVDADLIIHILNHIHESGKKGAILIFLPGYDHIISVRDKILANEKRFNEHGKLVLYLLHSKMQTVDQKKIFQPASAGQRKVILSTNIAETSITIDDVTFVIDSGKIKERCLNSVTGVYTLRCEWISQGCARQRRCRAGRTQPGACFHLFSSPRYRALQPHQGPGILREPLLELCLHSKLLAPPNSPIADFLARAIEPPSPLVTRNAVQLLKTMDALDAWEDLTDLGRHLLDIPIEPRYGKMLVYAIILKCLDPVLTIVCCLSYGDLFKIPSTPGQKRNLSVERKKLANNTFSDHMVYLRLFQGWQQARFGSSEQFFCEKHCVSSATLELVTGMRSQVLGQLRANGLVKTRGAGDIRDVNSNSENWAVVKAALTSGLYPNLARVDREHSVLRTQKEHKVLFHPSSVFFEPTKNARVSSASTHTSVVAGLPTDWVVYEQLSRVGRLSHISVCTVVSPITVGIFTGPTRLPIDTCEDADRGVFNLDAVLDDSDSEQETEALSQGLAAVLKLDDWLVFRQDPEAASLTYHLRLKWHSLLFKRLKNNNKAWTPADEAIVNTLVSVLSAEEQAIGLEQPQGVGQRPRPLNIDCFPQVRRSWDDYDGNQTNEDGNVFLNTIENSGSRFVNQTRFPESSPTKSNQDQDGKVATSGPSSPLGQNSSAVRQNDSNTRYFVIKAGNLKTVDASVSRGVWAFTQNTEKKIVETFKAGKSVILVFSLQSSGHFQGYARLRGDKCDQTEPLPEQGGNLSCLLPVEWVKRGNISFTATRHLVNPYNDNNKVQTSRDGQEIEPGVGEALCKMWDSPGGVVGWASKNPTHQNHPQHQNGFPGRPIRGRPHYNPHYYRK